MQPVTVVLLQNDSATTQSLAASLSRSFESVLAVGSLAELQATLSELVAAMVVLDIEAAPLREVSRLTRDFPAVNVVCNHRTPDERLWVQAMNAGAADCCSSSDVASIVRSALANSSMHAKAA